MQYDILGNTGITVSKICLGCMSFGTQDWSPWMLDETQSEPIFKAAVELGVNFFDSSDYYSTGVSEEITGKWLRKYTRSEETVIATKVFFPMSDKPNMGGLSRKHIQQACENSLKRLGVETIDLYQIHRMDPYTPMEETLYGLNLLVEQGKVRYIGASSMYSWQLMKALAISDENGWVKFSTMQNHYNLIYQEEAREMLPLCIDQNIAVLPYSPLARGMLSGTRKNLGDNSTLRSSTDNHDQILYDQPSDWEVVDAVKAVAAKRSVKPAQIALAWLYSQPSITSPIIGTTKPYQLEEAAKSLTIELTDEEISLLEAPYKAHSVKGLAPITIR